jgi:sugar transferase EpsL
MTRQRGLRRVIKAAFDRMAALLLLLLLWPLLAALSLGVFVTMGRPVMFRQKRPGYRGRIFELRKFRTMTDERNAAGVLLPDAQRLTRFGRLLRAWSLDELPQMLNVLAGNLSLVGPRPLLVQYLQLYSADQMRRHDVMPGITGWAQVNGRNAISWEEKFDLDLWYVDHWSLRLDAKILASTMARVVRRHGISQPGEVTMSEFLGSLPKTVE